MKNIKLDGDPAPTSINAMWKFVANEVEALAESKEIATNDEKGIKWDEHVFLNLNNQSVDEIESATLSI